MLQTILIVLVAVVVATVLFLAIGSRIEDENKSEKGLKLAVDSFGQYTEKLEYQIGRFILYDEPHNRILIGDEIIDDRVIMKMETQSKDPELYVVSSKKQYKTKTDTGSVIGRSVAGGLVAGPVGAIIGGTTASKTTEVTEKPQYGMTIGQYYITLYDDQDKFRGMIGTTEKKKYEAAIVFFSKLIDRNRQNKSQMARKVEEIVEPIQSPVDAPVVEVHVSESQHQDASDAEPVLEESKGETNVPKKHTQESEPTKPLPILNLRDELPGFILPNSIGLEELNQIQEHWDNPEAMKLPVAIGRDENSKVKIIDLAETPNLLIAGSRACNNRVVRSLKTVIYSLLVTKHPSEVGFVLMDAHRIDFMGYEKLFYHCLAVSPTVHHEKDVMANSIVSSTDASFQVLSSLNKEIDQRLVLLQRARCKSIEQYNKQFRERRLLPTEGYYHLKYLVVVVNEYAEFVSLTSRNVQPFINQLVRIAHKGQAVGVHLVLGTTYILREFIPSELIDCFPGVLSYRVNSWNESKILLGEMGAEKQSDSNSFVFKNDGKISALLDLDITEEEFDRVVEEIGKQVGFRNSYKTPYYLPDAGDDDTSESSGMISFAQLDERFEEAARLIVTSQRASTSDLQRRLGMGYAKAGRVMDQLEAAGIVGPQNGLYPREVLVKDFNELDTILSHFLR